MKWRLVEQKELPRGLTVSLAHNLDATHEQAYAITTTYNGVFMGNTPPMTESEARAEYECVWQLAVGPGGDATWRAVLDRLTGKPPPEACDAKGVAAAQGWFTFGSSNWLALQVLYRRWKLCKDVSNTTTKDG